jgi:PQQ-dependent catabolism-associated CXXCW motif protein
VRRLAIAVGLALLLCAADAPPEPSDYRMGDYRAPVPATLHGGVVITTAEAHAHFDRHDAVFIDVLPRPPRPVGLPPGTIWHPKPRSDIPGSVWLPDTGYGALAPVMQDYFARGLRQATTGDRDKVVVLYCLMDCWMSWNAAKRAIALGYTHVAWYPDGTDGWAFDDLPLEPRTPLDQPQASE